MFAPRAQLALLLYNQADVHFVMEQYSESEA
jgi:hypothetical protein